MISMNRTEFLFKLFFQLREIFQRELLQFEFLNFSGRCFWVILDEFYEFWNFESRKAFCTKLWHFSLSQRRVSRFYVDSNFLLEEKQLFKNSGLVKVQKIRQE